MADAEVVAATLIVEIVVKNTEAAVLEANPGEAGPPGDVGGHDFLHYADTPLEVAVMLDLVSGPQE
jgi:hypothetical protein